MAQPRAAGEGGFPAGGKMSRRRDNECPGAGTTREWGRRGSPGTMRLNRYRDRPMPRSPSVALGHGLISARGRCSKIEAPSLNAIFGCPTT